MFRTVFFLSCISALVLAEANFKKCKLFQTLFSTFLLFCLFFFSNIKPQGSSGASYPQQINYNICEPNDKCGERWGKVIQLEIGFTPINSSNTLLADVILPFFIFVNGAQTVTCNEPDAQLTVENFIHTKREFSFINH